MKKRTLFRKRLLAGIAAAALAVVSIGAEELVLSEDPGVIETTDAGEPEVPEGSPSEDLITEDPVEYPELDETSDQGMETLSDDVADETDDSLSTEEDSSDLVEDTEDVNEEESIEDIDQIEESEDTSDESEETGDPAQVGAASDEQVTMQSPVVYCVNPLYRDVVSEEDLNTPSGINGETGSLDDGTGEYDPSRVGNAPAFQDSSQAGSYLRGKLKERVQEVAISYSGSFSALDQWIDQAVSEMYLHTGVSTEGDYLAFQMAGHTYTYRYSTSSSGGDTCDAEISFAFTYYTTQQQEAAVTSSVNSVMKSLNLSGKSEYDKIYAIYNYICGHVTYDDANLSNDAYKLKYTAYAALINGTSVCQGYAVLLYRMLLEAGIDCRIISGTGNGGPHAWNIARIGSMYYNMDVTWDSNNYGYGYDYMWLLKGNNYYDFPDHAASSDYLTASFTQKFPLSESNYEAGESQLMSEAHVPVDASFTDVKGTKFNTRSFATDSTLLIFGRSSCGNSTTMLAQADGVVKKYGLSAKVVFLGIDDSDPGINDLADSYPDVVFVPASSNNGSLMFDFLGYCGFNSSSLTLPGAFVLDKNHNIAYWTTGYNTTALANTLHYGKHDTPIALNKNIYSVTTDKTSYSYGGKAVQPVVTVKTDSYGGFVLKKGRDYTVSYKDNNKAGTGTAVVTGINGFSGTLSCTFKITGQGTDPGTDPGGTTQLAAPSSLKLKQTAKGISLSWSRSQNATSYTVYRKAGSKTVKLASTGKLSYLDKKAKNGTSYTYYIVANANQYKSSAPGKAVKIVRLTVPGSVKLKAGRRRATVSWNKNAKASGYEIRFSLKKDMSKGKKATVNKPGTVEKVIKNLTAGKLYYFQVRAYKKVGGKKYYSAWSGQKKIKVG